MDTKICSHCKKEKALTEFSRDKGRRDGWCPHCKACKSVFGKQDYERHQERILKRASQYFKTPRGRYFRWKSNASNRHHLVLLTVEEFVAWYNQQRKVCHYCGCKLVDGGRQLNTLSIDCKDNALPYTIGNMALSCWRCNVMKGSWLTEAQMLDAAGRYLVDKEEAKQ